MPVIKKIDSDLRHKYACQKSKAKQRNIEFNLSYDEWLSIWTNSGHLNNRGCNKGSYVMSRFNDVGPYQVGNVFIQSKYNNDTEPQVKKKISQTKLLKRAA